MPGAGADLWPDRAGLTRVSGAQGERILTRLRSITGRMPGDHARRYRIVVRGEAGSLLAASLGETEVTSFRGWTSITASVQDMPEFYGLLDRLEDSRCAWSVLMNSLTPALDLPGDRAGLAKHGWPVRPGTIGLSSSPR
jgi:hypothetical protein